MIYHFVCTECKATGELLGKSDVCPNCGGLIHEATIIPPTPEEKVLLERIAELLHGGRNEQM